MSASGNDLNQHHSRRPTQPAWSVTQHLPLLTAQYTSKRLLIQSNHHHTASRFQAITVPPNILLRCVHVRWHRDLMTGEQVWYPTYRALKLRHTWHHGRRLHSTCSRTSKRFVQGKSVQLVFAVSVCFATMWLTDWLTVAFLSLFLLVSVFPLAMNIWMKLSAVD